MIVGYSRAVMRSSLFIGGSPSFSYTTSTNISARLPSVSMQAGDMMIAAVMHRDTLTTLPFGWVLIDTVTAAAPGSPNGFQKISLYRKVASSIDLGGQVWTFIQATSQRGAAFVLVFRNSGGPYSIIDHDVSNLDNSSAVNTPLAVSTATADLQLAVVFATYALAATSPSTTTMSLLATGFTQATPQVLADNRLCGGYTSTPMVNGGTTSGLIATDAYAAGGGWAAISAILGDAIWGDAITPLVPGSEASGFSGFTLKQVIPTSMFTVSGTSLRLTLRGGASTGCVIDKLYIGEWTGINASQLVQNLGNGNPGPTQFLKSGSGTITVPAGSTIVTDALGYSLDKNKNYVISMHITTPDTLALKTGTAVAAYQKAAVDETTTGITSGYTTLTAGNCYGITKLEVA